MKYLRQLRCKCYSAHKLPEVAPPKIEKRDFACLISNFRNVSLHTNPLQSSIMKYNKNETCGNLLLNKNLKRKACRSYDGEVMPFLKLPPPQNSCVTSKAKGPLEEWLVTSVKQNSLTTFSSTIFEYQIILSEIIKQTPQPSSISCLLSFPFYPPPSLPPSLFLLSLVHIVIWKRVSHDLVYVYMYCFILVVVYMYYWYVADLWYMYPCRFTCD